MGVSRLQKNADILFDAVSERKLVSGACNACVVGNFIAANNGYTIIKEGDNYVWYTEKEDKVYPYWVQTFMTREDGQLFNANNYRNESKEQIDSTGFTLEELMKIENIFERNTKLKLEQYRYHSDEDIRQDQMKGLVAVLNYISTLEDEVNDNNDIINNFIEKVNLIPLCV